MTEADYVVKPVFKALQVLRCLGEAERELSLGDVCARVGLPRSTTFKYLRTLRESGFVAHDPETDRYRIGLLVWELGQLAADHARVRDLALPTMRELHETFNETVNLAVPDGSDVVYVEMLESSRPLRMGARLGARDPMYCTALGRAILASLPADQWDTRIPGRLTARSPRTITSPARLRAELDSVRARGYALERGETEQGVSCVAAAILDGRGRAVAAISVSAPDARLTDDLVDTIAEQVRQAAGSCSRRLGHPPDATG
ncbi:MAG TPA: IclR family transcriptional regulator [Mycobacteriales bacterium]